MKIYVRERIKARKGKQPSYRVVATEGGNISMHVKHFRQPELEKISGDLGAELVYLTKDTIIQHTPKGKVKSK